jgi:hypothetical protein
MLGGGGGGQPGQVSGHIYTHPHEGVWLAVGDKHHAPKVFAPDAVTNVCYIQS